MFVEFVTMNDFTKEELKRIHQQLLEDRQWVDDLVNPDPLIEKIQSMIDNYCEHVNAVIDEKLKCVYCGHPSSIEVTKYKGFKRACDE